jgi:MFS family permease
LKKPRVFYGYWVLAACFISCSVGNGCGVVAFSLFVTRLETDMGWSRTGIMGALTIYLVCASITAPFAGRLVSRYGARTVISLGALLACLGFILLSQMTAFWHYYVGYAVIGTGLTAIGHVPSSYVVSQWFNKRRGLAIGIMSMGIGLGGIIYAPFVAVYLIPHFGWSSAYLALAVITGGLVIPLSLLVIRTKPADLGLFPDGIEASEAASTAEASASASGGLPLKMTLATPAFWLIAASLFFNHNHVGIFQNQVPHLEDIGFSAGIAASVMSICSIMATCGMFFFGWLCDKIPAKFASVIGLCLIALGIILFMNVEAGSPMWLIWLYAIVFGSGVGSWMPTMSMLTSTTFGLAAYGTIFGVVSIFQHLGAATGPLIAGYLYDTTNTYHLAFIIILVMVVLAIPLVLAVRRPSSYPTPEA